MPIINFMNLLFSKMDIDLAGGGVGSHETSLAKRNADRLLISGQEDEGFLIHTTESIFSLLISGGTDKLLLSGTSGSTESFLQLSTYRTNDVLKLSGHNCKNQIGLSDSIVDKLLLSPNHGDQSLLVADGGTDKIILSPLTNNEPVTLLLSGPDFAPGDELIMSTHTESNFLLFSNESEAGAGAPDTEDALLISGGTDILLLSGKADSSLLARGYAEDELLIHGYNTEDGIEVAGDCDSSIIDGQPFFIISE
jgi:hypothetical protein